MCTVFFFAQYFGLKINEPKKNPPQAQKVLPAEDAEQTSVQGSQPVNRKCTQPTALDQGALCICL